jgi:hypothetical protein
VSEATRIGKWAADTRLSPIHEIDPRVAGMSSSLLDSVLLFSLPVVVIVMGLLWSIGRAIDRISRKLEQLTEVLQKNAPRPKE